MKALVCEICGSNDVVKQEELFVCQHCGTNYSPEEARKIVGLVAVDRSAEIKNMIILARRAMDEGNAAAAAEYFGRAVEADPLNGEMVFDQAWCAASACHDDDIGQAADRLARRTDSAMKLIRDRQGSGADVARRAADMAKTLTARAEKCFHARVDGRDLTREDGSVDTSEHVALKGKLCAIGNLYKAAADGLDRYFPGESSRATVIRKAYAAFLESQAVWFSTAQLQQELRELTEKIRAREPGYRPPDVLTPEQRISAARSKEGCYIATCVYGSYDCQQVLTLRRFRDGVLARSRLGRAFIRVYYAVSPALVRRFGRAEWFRRGWRKLLDRLVSWLEK